jgi:tetratricopeptide (TPR) repeat protein
VCFAPGIVLAEGSIIPPGAVMSREIRALIAELRKKPHEVELLRAAQRALDDGKHSDELAHLLEWWAGYAPDDPLAAKALLDAARCYEHRPEKRAHELSLVTAALMRDPANEQAAYRLRQLLEVADDYLALEAQLSEWALAVRREGSPATLCALASFSLGLVRSNHLEDIDGAISALEDALRAFPEHPDAKRALADLYARRARVTLRADDRRAREDCHRAAQLYYELGNFELGEQAIACLLRALDLVPHHSAAMEALVRRVGTKNLELLRKRLAGYVSLSPDRVRTHRFRFELVRTLFRERRHAEAVPHLTHLASRGYAEARRILDRLSPELAAQAERVPEVPPAPAYDTQETKMEMLKVSREAAERTSWLEFGPTAAVVARPRSSEAARDLISGPVEEDTLDESCEITLAEEDVRVTNVHDELATLEYDRMSSHNKVTRVFEDAARDDILRKMHRDITLDDSRASEPPQRPTLAPPGRPRKLEHTLALSVFALTSAVALTSYVLGLVH